MSVELTHNNHRYMVENGQWYRRLEVGEVVNWVNEMRSTLNEKWHQCCSSIGGIVSSCEVNDYRVKCTDPRPPFVVGQRVKVARAEENGWGGTFIGVEGEVVSTHVYTHIGVMLDGGLIVMSPWCLDAVS